MGNLKNFNPITVSIEYALRCYNQGKLPSSRSGLRVPSWHRADDAWPPRLRSKLVETVLLRMPLPPIWLIGTIEAGELTDGLQRIAALDLFRKGAFRLGGLELLPEHNGKAFHDLPADVQANYIGHPLYCYVMKETTPDCRDVAKRMSTILNDR